MSYGTTHGKRPFEMASKNMHSHVIKDPDVVAFLNNCHLPPSNKDVQWNDTLLCSIDEPDNPVQYVIAFDGGYTDTIVKSEFPSSKMAFYQFGALMFSLKDLESISKLPFIDPEDIQKLKQIERFKLAVPTKNIVYKGCRTLTESFRQLLHDFFNKQRDAGNFNSALKWLIFREYDSTTIDIWNLSVCPVCNARNISIRACDITSDFTFHCSKCGGTLFLVDLLRLHEAIDDELGAGGVLGYLTTTLEQILLVFVIKLIYTTKPDLFVRFLFVKDGPLAFFGQTANLHKPMREMINFISAKYPIYLVGVEKSGAFVEHSIQINQRIKCNTALMLNNDYIYRNIIPGTGNIAEPYGSTTYYGNKIIFKSNDGDIFVITIPTPAPNLSPAKNDFKGLDIICSNLARLKCHSYDSSLIPVALANKLVSLSNHPSAVILGKFAQNKIL